MPVLVFFLLESLDPVIGYAHRHAVVKTDAAILDGYSETRHAAHFFGDGDSVGVYFMDELVGEGKIGDCVCVLSAVIVVVIAVECLSESVAVVEHRGHSVKTETVKTEFLKPILAVG